jgi:SAM-dependent methyltransferase
MKSPANAYSSRWFEAFHTAISPERTEREAEFISAMAPLAKFRNVLDVCCGMGRHARALARRGYAVTGIERDAAALARARESGGGPTYVQADIRNYRPEHSAFDLVISMSQSFGYFDARTNRELLQRLAESLRPGGRMILDLWNPEFFEQRRDERDLQTPAGIVRESKCVEENRLIVDLLYSDGPAEKFEWQMFSPHEMKTLAESIGLEFQIAWTGFDAATKPTADNPRIQFVLQRKN